MKLRQWLSKANMSISHLARNLNIDKSLIHRWFNGERRIGPRTLKLLYDVTNGEINHVDDVREF
jgi:transcriptional regulator with XRE-family HTH domain